MKDRATLFIRIDRDLHSRILRHCNREPNEHGHPKKGSGAKVINEEIVAILKREFPKEDKYDRNRATEAVETV